jgi:hypothetical protein
MVSIPNFILIYLLFSLKLWNYYRMSEYFDALILEYFDALPLALWISAGASAMVQLFARDRSPRVRWSLFVFFNILYWAVLLAEGIYYWATTG